MGVGIFTGSCDQSTVASVETVEGSGRDHCRSPIPYRPVDA